MKKLILNAFAGLAFLFLLSGCYEHRYYHTNHHHSDSYEHHHHQN